MSLVWTFIDTKSNNGRVAGLRPIEQHPRISVIWNIGVDRGCVDVSRPEQRCLYKMRVACNRIMSEIADGRVKAAQLLKCASLSEPKMKGARTSQP